MRYLLMLFLVREVGQPLNKNCLNDLRVHSEMVRSNGAARMSYTKNQLTLQCMR